MICSNCSQRMRHLDGYTYWCDRCGTVAVQGAESQLVPAILSPDMLKALKVALPYLQQAFDCGNDADDGCGDRWRKLKRELDTIKAVIAKAEGRS